MVRNGYRICTNKRKLWMEEEYGQVSNVKNLMFLSFNVAGTTGTKTTLDFGSGKCLAWLHWCLRLSKSIMLCQQVGQILGTLGYIGQHRFKASFSLPYTYIHIFQIFYNNTHCSHISYWKKNYKELIKILIYLPNFLGHIMLVRSFINYVSYQELGFSVLLYSVMTYIIL